MSKPALLGKTEYLKRRVPNKYAPVETRSFICDRLKTGAYSVAMQKSAGVWLLYLEGWEARLAGRDGDAAENFRAAQKLAEIGGFQFLRIDKVAQVPLEEVLQQVETLRQADGAPDESAASALLGLVEPPKLRLSGLVKHVEKVATHDNCFKNSEHMRLCRTPRQRAVTNLIAAIGKGTEVASFGPAGARA